MLQHAVFDAEGNPIEPGVKLDGGNGVEGVVKEIREPGKHWAVGVEWPDNPDSLDWIDAPRDWRDGRCKIDLVLV